MRERHRGADGELPSLVLCGDLNCTPDTAAAQLLLKGDVPSDHPDWQFSSQFSWSNKTEEDVDVGDDEGCAQ